MSLLNSMNAVAVMCWVFLIWAAIYNTISWVDGVAVFEAAAAAIQMNRNATKRFTFHQFIRMSII